MHGEAYLRAQTLMSVNRHEQAVEMLLEAITMNPDDAMSHTMLGRCLMEIGRPNMALKYAGTAVSLEPDNGYALYVLGWIHFRRNEHSVARETLLNALQFDPENATVHALLGDIERCENNLAKCHRHCTQALSVDPTNILAYVVRSQAFIDEKKYDEAVKMLNAGLRVDPQDEDLRSMLGKIKIKQNKYDEAEEHLEASLKTDPTRKREQINLDALRARIRWYHWPILPIVGPLRLGRADAYDRSRVILSHFTLILLVGGFLGGVLQIMGGTAANPLTIKSSLIASQIVWGTYTLVGTTMACIVAAVVYPWRIRQRKQGQSLQPIAPNRLVYRVLIPVCFCVTVCGLVSMAAWGWRGLAQMSCWVLPVLPALFIIVTPLKRQRFMAIAALVLAGTSLIACLVNATSDGSATKFDPYNLQLWLCGGVILVLMITLENVFPDPDARRRRGR